MGGLKLNSSSFKVELENKTLTRATPKTEIKIRLGRNLSSKVKEAFYLELSVMLSAGVDIKSALELISDRQRKGNIQGIIKQLIIDIVSGLSLSDAIEKSRCFTAYDYYSIRIGEETGRVEAVLTNLAEHYNKRIKLRRQLIQALSYPVIVLMTAFGAVVFMLRFIVPMFSEVFGRFGGELPQLTVAIIQMAKFLESYFIIIIAGILLLMIFCFNARNTIWFRRAGTKFILSLPVIGEMVRIIALARMCEALSMLISARIPLVQAISMVKEMVGFYPLETSLSLIGDDILHGQSLFKSLSKFSIYDQRLVALVRVGEESNKLDFFFKKLAGYYSDEIEHQSSVLGSLLEPLIIIFLGIVVGVILLAMYLPLFELSSNFQ